MTRGGKTRQRKDSPEQTKSSGGLGGAFRGEIAATAIVILAAIAGILVAGLGVLFIDFVFEIFGIALGAMGNARHPRTRDHNVGF